MHAQYELFDCIGGIHRAKRAGDAGMFKFMNQSPRHVARFVSLAAISAAQCVPGEDCGGSCSLG